MFGIRRILINMEETGMKSVTVTGHISLLLKVDLWCEVWHCIAN